MTLVPLGYRPRLLDGMIARRLKGFGAVEVAGTKFCDEVWASLAQGRSVTHIDEFPRPKRACCACATR